MPTIDLDRLVQGDTHELRAFYRQFVRDFRGNFWRMRTYYGHKRSSLLRFLRQGKVLT